MAKADECNLKVLGACLKARRKAQKMNQIDLAAKIGVREQQVSRWETGRDVISDVNLELFAMNCGCRGENILEDVIS